MTFMARTIAATSLCLVVGLLSRVSAAEAQSPLFEVEKSDATKLLQVSDDAGFLVRGELGSGTIPANGAGVRLMWHPGKGAFRAGMVTGSQWDEAQIGLGSAALGHNAGARGDYSLASGQDTQAGGDYSIAGGFHSTASGGASLALGNRVVASGFQAVALGFETVASGKESFAAGFRTKAVGNGSAALGEEAQTGGANALAAGFRTQANGNASMATGTGTVAAGAASVALGSGVTAQGDGSFIFGDRNTQYQFPAAPNQFLVRAFGGIGFNSGVNIGCDLPPNTGAWSCTSSKRMKEDFEDVDGEDVLARLKEVPIQRWRYIGTDARHLGPFAEDFHAAFGLGDEADKIAQIDADGVALSAVQALERRTAELQAENADLRRRLESLESAFHHQNPEAAR